MSAERWIVTGFGYEVELQTTLGPDAARRRAMWTLIASGYIEAKGSPDEMLARFTAELA